MHSSAFRLITHELHNRSSKLVMRVRFPSPALSLQSRFGKPTEVRALSQVRWKFERQSWPPFGPTKTKPCSPGSANPYRCQRISGAISAGNATIRRPARDLGARASSATTKRSL